MLNIKMLINGVSPAAAACPQVVASLVPTASAPALRQQPASGTYGEWATRFGIGSGIAGFAAMRDRAAVKHADVPSVKQGSPPRGELR